MTVPGEASTVAAVDRAAAEQQFTEIYREHWTRLRQYVYFGVPLDKAHLAEDLAQEAFTDLWRRLLNGLEVTRPYGLLRKIAATKISDYYRVKSNLEYKAVDFHAPEGSAFTEANHRYAAGDPALASLAAELDQAMTRMQDASASWRELHRRTYELDQMISHGSGTSADTADLRGNAETARRNRDAALVQLQKACGAVGTVRAELEQIAGPNWKSSTNLPASTMSDGKARTGSVSSDMTRTHCDAGHPLDLDNCTYSPEGRRRCRKCSAAGKSRQRKGLPGRFQPASQAVLDRALAVLLDPSNVHRPLTELAPETGLSVNTLRRKIPDLVDRRRQVAMGAAQ